jgi:hypothetical protein
MCGGHVILTIVARPGPATSTPAGAHARCYPSYGFVWTLEEYANTFTEPKNRSLVLWRRGTSYLRTQLSQSIIEIFYIFHCLFFHNILLFINIYFACVYYRYFKHVLCFCTFEINFKIK